MKATLLIIDVQRGLFDEVPRLDTELGALLRSFDVSRLVVYFRA